MCIFHDGTPVVDIWGGWVDEDCSVAWSRETIVNIWSVTKGVTAICFAMAIDKGLASYDDPVARYWPEFAANEKAGITIADLLSHQGGLAAFDWPADIDDLLSGDAAADRLARQKPMWSPGTASGYHLVSIGLLATALFRRIEGRSIRRFVAEELGKRRGFDIQIGLTRSDRARASSVYVSPSMDLSRRDDPSPLQTAVFTRPPLDALIANEPSWFAADLPSANGFSNARALAALYANVIAPLRPLVGPDTLEEAILSRSEGDDLVLNVFARWAAGFVLNADGLYGPNPRAFGHTGWGGAFAFADPEARLTVSYTPNKMGYRLRDDPRANALIEAIYRVI